MAPNSPTLPFKGSGPSDLLLRWYVWEPLLARLVTDEEICLAPYLVGLETNVIRTAKVRRTLKAK